MNPPCPARLVFLPSDIFVPTPLHEQRYRIRKPGPQRLNRSVEAVSPRSGRGRVRTELCDRLRLLNY